MLLFDKIGGGLWLVGEYDEDGDLEYFEDGRPAAGIVEDEEILAHLPRLIRELQEEAR